MISKTSVSCDVIDSVKEDRIPRSDSDENNEDPQVGDTLASVLEHTMKTVSVLEVGSCTRISTSPRESI